MIFFALLFSGVPLIVSFLVGDCEGEAPRDLCPAVFGFFSTQIVPVGQKKAGLTRSYSVFCYFFWKRWERWDKIKLFLLLQCSPLQ